MREDLSERDVWSLFDVSWASESGGLDGYLRTLLDRSAQWFGASSASIFLRQESGEFLLAARRGRGPRFPLDATVVPGSGIAGASIDSGEPLLVTDPRENARLAGKIRARADIGSSMIVPLMTPESGCIGVVNLARGKAKPEFDENDLRQAKSFARHLALGVSNARLFARMNWATMKARTLHEKLVAVIERLGVGVVVLNRFGELTECNPEAALWLGERPREGAQWFDVLETIAPALARPFEEVLTGALAGKATRLRAHDPESDRAWSLTASPMPDGGATLAIHEVTEFERSQRELEQAKRLAEIGQMTAAIAHEIRNPLTGIRSAAQFLGQNPEEAQEFAHIIEDEAVKLNELCDEFLEFARPLSLRTEPVRLSEVARKIAQFHASDFQLAQVRLKVQISPREPIIRGDPARLEQICRNLVLNAMQACAIGGTVVLEVTEGGFEVRDDGCGMSKAVRERVFAPFFTTKAAGTGLGLSNVRKIVDAHGGSIEVVSHEGRGTTFRVCLLPRKIA